MASNSEYEQQRTWANQDFQYLVCGFKKESTKNASVTNYNAVARIAKMQAEASKQVTNKNNI